jgi:hypothetical protein
MAARDRAQHSAEQGAALVEQLRSNAYVQALLEDHKLRETIIDAVEHGRKAYGRAAKAKQPTKAVFSDKKLQRELAKSYVNAKVATIALREAPLAQSKKKSHGFRRFLLVTIVGGIVALAASSGDRSLLMGPNSLFATPVSEGNLPQATGPVARVRQLIGA